MPKSCNHSGIPNLAASVSAKRAARVMVESRGGISPPRAHRTVREPLGSYGSCRPARPAEEGPVRKQPWPGLSLSGQPPGGAPLGSAGSLRLLAGPSSQVEVDVPEGGIQGGAVELAVVEDPAPDDRVEHPRQIGQLLVLRCSRQRTSRPGPPNRRA